MGTLSNDEKTAIRQKGIHDWWDSWYEKDYSWDGLAQKPWWGWVFVEDETVYADYINSHGLPDGAPNDTCCSIPENQIDKLPEGTDTRQATLQDYWRDQEGDLEKYQGKSYTTAHLPIQDGDRPGSWKDDPHHPKWEKLNYLIAHRVNRGAKEDDRIDRRSQFQGCVLLTLPPKATRSQGASDDPQDIALHLTCKDMIFTQTQSFNGTIFGSATNFQTALFGGDASFRSAEFSGGHAYFRGAQFSGGDAYFVDAEFTGGDAYFRKSQFSGGYASFRDAEFSGGYADFGDAEFSGGYADFGSAQFHKNWRFQGAVFDKEVSFQNSVFTTAKSSQIAFRGTQFMAPIDFSRNHIKDAKDKDGNPLYPHKTLFPFNAFESANIKDQLTLTAQSDADADADFNRFMKALKTECKNEDEKTQEQTFAAVEKSCMTLKHAMDNRSDKTRMHRFFKFELLARNQRPKTPKIVKGLTRQYGFWADYGNSILRPSLAMVGVFVLSLGAQFAIFNKCWAGGQKCGFDPSLATEAFERGTAFALPPFTLLINKTITEDTDADIPGYLDILSGGVMLLHAIIASTFLFLMLLAIKRRMQIK